MKDLKTTANNGEIKESDLPSDVDIVQCGSDSDAYRHYALFRDSDGEITCRSYSQTDPQESFEVNISSIEVKNISSSAFLNNFTKNTLTFQLKT